MNIDSRFRARLAGLILVSLCIASVTTGAWRREDGIPGGVQGQRPIAVTCLGESNDLTIVADYFGRAGIQIRSNPLLKAGEILDAGSLVLVIGLPGNNQALHLERARDLLSAARDRRITVIALFLGTDAIRPRCQGFIDLAVPQCALLIATTGGNRDGFFTRLAGERHLNLLLLDSVSQLGEVFPKLFP